MTKKQFGIIFTLMALIVCVGVLASKLNTNGLTDPSDLGAFLPGEEELTEKTDAKAQEKADKAAKKEQEKADEAAEKEAKKKDTETLATQEYLYSQRITKDNETATTMEDLNALIADANTSQENKDIATLQLQEKIMIKDKEGRMELNVKNKGYEDVLCFIEGNKVRVVLKVEDTLTEEQTSAIQEIVEDVSNISEVIIEPKK